MKSLKNILAASVAAMFTVVCLAGCVKVPVVEADHDDSFVTTAVTTVIETTAVTTEISTTAVTTTEITTITTTEATTEVTTTEVTTEAPKPTEPVTEAPATEQEREIVETEATVQETQPPVIVEPEYVVYKASTHYIHRSTCRWAKSGDPVRIENTEGIEARKCSECNPEMDIITEYVEPQPTYNCSLSDYEYNLIMQLMCNEYGSGTMIERAKIVAATMNACNRNGWSVETFVYRACVPFGFTPGYSSYHGVAVSDMADAMEYYFTYGTAGFYDSGYWCEGADSWWGDGYYNHFYRA